MEEVDDWVPVIVPDPLGVPAADGSGDPDPDPETVGVQVALTDDVGVAALVGVPVCEIVPVREGVAPLL